MTDPAMTEARTCKHIDCTRPIHCRDVCGTHYKQLLDRTRNQTQTQTQTQTPNPKPRRPRRPRRPRNDSYPCDHPNCTRTIPNPGLCPTHKRAARLENALFLLNAGTHPTFVAQRLDFTSVGALNRFLNRHATEQKAAS